MGIVVFGEKNLAIFGTLDMHIKGGNVMSQLDQEFHVSSVPWSDAQVHCYECGSRELESWESWESWSDQAVHLTQRVSLGRGSLFGFKGDQVKLGSFSNHSVGVIHLHSERAIHLAAFFYRD